MIERMSTSFVYVEVGFHNRKHLKADFRAPSSENFAFFERIKAVRKFWSGVLNQSRI